MTKLTISLVTYNSEKYLRDFCDSLHEQTFLDWELIVVDNASYDHSVSVLSECMPRAKVIKQKENIGFAKAHNLAITWSKSLYVMVVNPDFIFAPQCLERLIRYADEKTSTLGAVGPKLLSWDSEAHAPTGAIDSCGIALSGPYRFFDHMQGQKDQTIVSHRVFGLSGACVMFVRSAIEDVKLPRFGGIGFEYFDEDFFAYKEDVDMAWRLDLAGYEQHIVSDALAYHQRTVSGTAVSRQERKLRSGVNRYSYRNHLLMVYKDHTWSYTLRHLFPLLWFELGKYVYLAFLDGSSVRGLSEVIRLLPKFRKKRALIKKHTRIKSREFAALAQ
jgi:GT2 family glycosyltransferase